MSSVTQQDTPAEIVLPLAYTNRWVRGVELPASAYLVHGRIPYGIWSHAAPPGGYKSAIASQLEHQLSYGTPLPGLDAWDFVQHGDCLVITPDESIYEIQDRTYRVLPGGDLDTDGAEHTPTAGVYDIHYRHSPEGRTLTERIGWMVDQIEQLEKSTGNKVVWIRYDTVGSLLGEKSGTDAYTHAGPLQKLNAWLASTGRILFAPNHIGKDGRAIGTVALAAFSNLVTETEVTRESNTGVLKASKLRGAQLWEAALKFKNGIAEFDDSTPHQAAHQLGSLPRRILDQLVYGGPQTAKQLLAATSLAKPTFWACMTRLRTQGDICRAEGLLWSLTDKGTARTACPEPIVETRNNVLSLGNATNAANTGNAYNASTEQLKATLRAEIHPTQTADQVPAHVSARPPQPPWRERSERKAAPVELIQVNASWHMDDKRKVWDHSPIAAAIDLIMADRDAGRLTPTWRCELPAEVQKLIKSGTDVLDGGHNHGQLPRRRMGELLAQPAGPWVSYDVAGSFLASYKTHLAIKPLNSYDGAWDPKAAGLVLARTPEWLDERIGHPWGDKARPGTLQLVWNPLMRLARQLADEPIREGSDRMVWEFPEIHGMWLRTGYQNASEALFEGFYKRMKLARETFPKDSDELAYVKAMYSAWLASAANGTSNVFKREDWTGTVRSEAFGPRLWSNGWRAVKAGAHLWGMGNTDELCFTPGPLLEELFPPDDSRIGKMRMKDWGGDR